MSVHRLSAHPSVFQFIHLFSRRGMDQLFWVTSLMVRGDVRSDIQTQKCTSLKIPSVFYRTHPLRLPLGPLPKKTKPSPLHQKLWTRQGNRISHPMLEQAFTDLVMNLNEKKNGAGMNCFYFRELIGLKHYRNLIFLTSFWQRIYENIHFH